MFAGSMRNTFSIFVDSICFLPAVLTVSRNSWMSVLADPYVFPLREVYILYLHICHDGGVVDKCIVFNLLPDFAVIDFRIPKRKFQRTFWQRFGRCGRVIIGAFRYLGGKAWQNIIFPLPLGLDQDSGSS